MTVGIAVELICLVSQARRQPIVMMEKEIGAVTKVQTYRTHTG